MRRLALRVCGIATIVLLGTVAFAQTSSGQTAQRVEHAQIIQVRNGGTGTTSNVASSATNVTLLASNMNRRTMTIYNDSTQVLFVKFAATASATSYTFQMGPGAYYEMPIGFYSGIIDGLWASANGNARITEIT